VTGQGAGWSPVDYGLGQSTSDFVLKMTTAANLLQKLLLQCFAVER